ncbi:MAG: hypothetical protein IJV40_12175 [Oscillospiraceae bacterium]|nr:hypothetical protein [Oscillospiraceae bacterium]
MNKTVIAYREYDPIHDVFSAILDFDLEALQKKYDEGIRFYAFYSDSTRSEVKPEEIKRLGEAKQQSLQFIQPAYVNERTLAIFDILNGIMEPLLEILPDSTEEDDESEIEAATLQKVTLKSTAKTAALAKSSTTYKNKVRAAFQTLKTLVEMGDETNDDDK